MGKADYGSPKFVAKQMKARGLQKLRWYCQVCEKQCRDENGYKCHTQAPSHLAKIREKGGRAHTEEYSRQFQEGFLRALRLSHGSKAANANRVYNDYIHDKTHVHMTATRWATLAGFVRHLGAAGICRVETQAGGSGPTEFVIAYIDRSGAERQAREHHERTERAQASARAADELLRAQLRAAEEDALAPEPQPPLQQPPQQPPQQLPPQPPQENQPQKTTGENKAPRISFSLASHRRRAPRSAS